MTHRRVCPNKCQHQSLYSWLDLATGFTQLRDSQAGFHQEFRANHEVVPWWLRIWLFGTVGRPTIWTLIELRWAYPSTDHLYSMSTIYNRWWSLIIRHTAPPRDSQLDHPEGVEINGRPDFGGSGENSMLYYNCAVSWCKWWLMVFVKLWGIMSVTSALNLMLAQIFRKLYFLVTFMYKLPNSLVFHSKWMMMMICLNCNQRLVLE